MPTETLHNGETVTWTGQNICFCVSCREIFNSVAAFDRHITGKGDARVHDHSWMPRNAKGYKVTSLSEKEW